tara:strand:- start:15 stop:314 length:300 start_codon:yes stop_codon:yes gene_type:complete
MNPLLINYHSRPPITPQPLIYEQMTPPPAPPGYVTVFTQGRWETIPRTGRFMTMEEKPGGPSATYQYGPTTSNSPSFGSGKGSGGAGMSGGGGAGMGGG